MTGRRLYEKYTDALAATQQTRWDHGERKSLRTYPVHTPAAWAFLPDRERKTYNMLARLITPRRRRRPE